MTLDLALQNGTLSKRLFAGRQFDVDDNQDQAEAVKDIYLTLRKHASSLHKTGEAGDMKKWAALVNTALQALEQTRSALSTAEDHIQEQQVRLDALVELATKDELTGLFNRRGFLDGWAD